METTSEFESLTSSSASLERKVFQVIEENDCSEPHPRDLLLHFGDKVHVWVCDIRKRLLIYGMLLPADSMYPYITEVKWWSFYLDTVRYCNRYPDVYDVFKKFPNLKYLMLDTYGGGSNVQELVDLSSKTSCDITIQLLPLTAHNKEIFWTLSCLTIEMLAVTPSNDFNIYDILSDVPRNVTNIIFCPTFDQLNNTSSVQTPSINNLFCTSASSDVATPPDIETLMPSPQQQQQRQPKPKFIKNPFVKLEKCFTSKISQMFLLSFPLPHAYAICFNPNIHTIYINMTMDKIKKGDKAFPNIRHVVLYKTVTLTFLYRMNKMFPNATLSYIGTCYQNIKYSWFNPINMIKMPFSNYFANDARIITLCNVPTKPSYKILKLIFMDIFARQSTKMLVLQGHQYHGKHDFKPSILAVLKPICQQYGIILVEEDESSDAAAASCLDTPVCVCFDHTQMMCHVVPHACHFDILRETTELMNIYYTFVN